MRAVWASQPDLQRRMETAKPLLEKFVMDDSLKAHLANWPSTEGHKNLLLYVDKEHDFVVNAAAHARPNRQRARPRRCLGVYPACSTAPKASSAMTASMTAAARIMPRSSSPPSPPACRQGPHPGAAARHPCQAGRPRPFGRDHHPQPAARRKAPCCRAPPRTSKTKKRTEGYGPTQVPYELVGV